MNVSVSKLSLAVALAACSSSENNDAPVDASVEAADAAAVVVSSCPAGEFATGFNADGTLACAPIDAGAFAAVEQSCSLFWGWRDSCDGCQEVPTKWGEVSGAECANGAGADNTCITASLGGVDLPLFGLNTDGDVNGDDKLYFGVQCAVPDDTPTTGPCAEGSYLAGIAGGGECVTTAAAVAEYVNQGCEIYFGWRDSCDGCTTAPLKWGRASAGGCELGAGADSGCLAPQLGDTLVQTLAINTDGDVNGDDKLYFGMQCSGASATLSLQESTCPPGELVVGIDITGSVECANLLPEAQRAIRSGCSLYAGWLDSCGGCTTAPSKWGRVSHDGCENGAGADNTCAPTTLDAQTTIPMFGLNTDGDVNGDDKFFVGLACE